MSFVKSWLSSTKQTAFRSTQNTVIASIATASVLIVCTITFIKWRGSAEFRPKKDFESHKRTEYINKLPKGNNLEAPEPGKIMIKDYRKDANKTTKPNRNYIRIITWNIERGYKINEIIHELKAKDADIILLQEVDIGTKRTNMMDIGSEIASSLSFQMVYAADLWKVNIYHENDTNYLRNDSESYNSLPHNGCEGNAILTRFDIIKAYPVVIPCVRNSFVPSHDLMKRHTAVVAIIDTHQYNIDEMVCYSLHFDAFSGRVSRSTVQYKCIYRDIINNDTLSKYDKSIDGVNKKRRAVVIGGDFNTHNHGLARLIDKMSGDDAFRYKFWGLSEAKWWDKFVIGKELHLIDNLAPSLRVRLRDPFDKDKDITACKIWHGINVWSAKIDWLLYDIDKLAIVNKCVSNSTASDHQYLLCDVTAKT